MRVLLLSTSDIGGGAAIATYRIHRGLKAIGVDSTLLVDEKRTDDPSVIQLNVFQRANTYIKWKQESIQLQKYRNRDRAIAFSTGVHGNTFHRIIDEINPSIINAHWICGGFASLQLLEEIRRPLVWSFHDMWGFTGGCHYDQECGKYMDHCGHCPVLGSDNDMDLSRMGYLRKRRLFDRKKDIFPVCSSNWLARCASESSLLGDKEIKVIHTGVDLTLFQAVDRLEMKNKLGWPVDKKVILFGALHGKGDVRKGFHLIKAASQFLDKDKYCFAFFGNDLKMARKEFPGFEVFSMGLVKNESALARIYAAADLLLLPSLQENLANISLEALACGTPVVGFEIGGNRDMISHRKEGYLAKPYDCEELAAGIEWVISNDQHKILCKNARIKAETLFNYTQAAANYLSLYQSILNISLSGKAENSAVNTAAYTS